MTGKEPYHHRILAAAVLALALTAAMPALAAEPASAQDGARSAAFDAVTFAKGAKLWAETCGSCHNLRDPKELTDAEWDVAMGQMWVRAGLTAEQVRDITAFLKASN